MKLKHNLILSMLLSLTGGLHAEEANKFAELKGAKISDTQLIVKLKEGVAHSDAEIDQIIAGSGLVVEKGYQCSTALKCVSITYDGREGMTAEAKGKVLENKIKELMATGNYEYVEPDQVISLNAVPTDNLFSDGDQWALNNYGQGFGTDGIDINVLPVWEETYGDSDVIVAVIDSGVRYTHIDITDNMWQNTAEINGRPGVDDDNNGFVDDFFGCDTINNDGDPMDDANHGTAVAGVIAASANGTGIVGVAPNVRIMACKFTNSGGFGLASDAVEAIEYAVTMGADILNNSWGQGSDFSNVLADAADYAEENGVLFVAAAGNSGTNNDNNTIFPASLPNDNVISVASITKNGSRANSSNFGENSVDLGAPGFLVRTLSNSGNSRYRLSDGTSFAAPHVSGVAALLKSIKPNITIAEYRSSLLDTVTPLDSLDGRTVSGGMVNAGAAVASLSLSTSGQVVTMQKANTSYSLDADNGGANGQNVYLWSSSNSNVNQQFVEVDRGDGFYTYTKRNTDFALDGGRGGARRQNLYIWSVSDNNFNQHWRKISKGNGAYQLQKRNALNYSIDGNAGGARRQNVYLWSTSNNNVNQQWVIQEN